MNLQIYEEEKSGCPSGGGASYHRSIDYGKHDHTLKRIQPYYPKGAYHRNRRLAFERIRQLFTEMAEKRRSMRKDQRGAGTSICIYEGECFGDRQKRCFVYQIDPEQSCMAFIEYGCDPYLPAVRSFFTGNGRRSFPGGMCITIRNMNDSCNE